jgi:hypothetical protein
MARPIEKEGTGKHNGDRAFIAQRVKDLATMYLTRRKDLEVKFPTDCDNWVDCIVEITGKERPSRRVFGLQLKGTMSPVTDEHANKVLRSAFERMQTRRGFTFPVGLLYFTMANNEGRFTWFAEPKIKSGQPVLRYHDEAQTRILNETTLEELVNKMNQWFDAMPADAGDITCGKCGTVLYGESSSGAASDRKPCPCCGSTTRSFAVCVCSQFNIAATIQAEVVTYPQALLKNAASLITAKQYNEALVIAHMACEIAAERAFAKALAKRPQRTPKETGGDLPTGYNLANEQTRKQYTEVTGDNIQDQPFWPAFAQFVHLRNQIVHASKKVSRAEAEASLKAATGLVHHLNE